LLNEDLAIVFRGGALSGLIEPVKRQFGRLHVEPGDLAARGVNSPLFSLAYLERVAKLTDGPLVLSSRAWYFRLTDSEAVRPCRTP
jgi:hypothetical protein